MKNFICLILCFCMLIPFIGCDSTDNESTVIEQKLTLVTMPSPPKCKTTDNLSTINKVLNVLGEIEKTPIDGDKAAGGWYFMIKLTVDGTTVNYTVGNIFTDADGKQYNVENWDYIKDKLTEIYNEMDEEEANYT